jgi:tripartite-type tricarboxylate transporter receptor subunit TctC
LRALIGRFAQCVAAAVTAIALLLVVSATPALAQQSFPGQSIEVVVPFGAGGGADQMARKLALMLERFMGVSLFVSNIPGASGNAGLTRLLTNPADGHTIAVLVGPTVSAWASGIGYAKPEDFEFLGITQQSPSMMFVPADSPFRTFRGMLDFARTHPGRVRVATSGYGSNDDLTLKYFEALGFRMTNVPYAKPEQRYESSFGKRTHAIYEEPGDVAELLAARRLRPLVVFGRERHAAFEDVPSSTELGFDISDLPTFRVLIVRAGTPADRQRVLVDALAKALETPEWKKYCLETHSCTRAHTPQQAAERVRTFFETSRKYMKQFAVGRAPG